MPNASRHRNAGDVHRPDLVGPRHGPVSRADADGSCAPAPASRSSDAGGSRRCPGASSAPWHGAGRSCGLRRRAGPSASSFLRTDGPDAIHRSGASASDPHPRPGAADGAPADPEGFRPAADAQPMSTADRRLALGRRPALPSATARKSFSSVSSPILACSVFTSTAGEAASALATAPNTPQAPSRSCARHRVIWLERTSNRSAGLAGVRSRSRAASAPFALNAGPWFRRGHPVMVAPRSRHHAEVAPTIHSTRLFGLHKPSLKNRKL
jgi:hypothetical protein